ncbi:UbiA family prenyltransferase [Pseudomonas sp. CDFA 602]|uniref:UbiA family prenyltransferase n=1 Tax=Pseudomonas californiensis TaxID=2829823 RepID=UPI001E364E82|nr:UbiA family prenyltransferase [Pseudomonas californiensis]MCD5995598.1 UbiA family prenyltransferase [Pseudomonas californiensis]MCD6001192.1 UbiA family prenyltransferase [Pseudomonas californiensis]
MSVTAPLPQPVPLVIDLDGTLLRSDLLLETGMAFLRSQPLQCLKPLGWLTKSKATLKEGLALATDIDVSVLPYDPQVIEFINTERKLGRQVVLATASHHTLAERIAVHLQLFDCVMASDSERNLSSHCKRDLLIEHFGEKGFDYMGNSHDDMKVWAAARNAYVVNPESGVERKARAQGNVAQVIQSNVSGPKDWLKALRLHQWMKNVLIFVPLLASHQLTNPLLLWQGILGFLFFGLCASSVYLLNDLLDLADDRHHKTKRNRPFASGRLSIRFGLMVFPLLLLVTFAGSLWLLPIQFSAVLAAYYILTLAYSLSLKRQMAVDVIALAMLYTVRIIAGAAAFQQPLTFWILAFSMFIFLSLALVKRYAELREARTQGLTKKTRGRGYYPGDLEMISSLGAASGYLSVMVLALYIHDGLTTALYSNPQVIWLGCPLLLFWITRVWMLTHRGEMHDDPVVFAIRDRVSIVVGILFCLVFWVAT